VIPFFYFLPQRVALSHRLPQACAIIRVPFVSIIIPLESYVETDNYFKETIILSLVIPM
jgi:hypothetical protein